jgi:predicted metalloprotease with PDZ domain
VAVEYTLSMPEPHTHLFQVEMRIPATSEPLELVLPTWTPGSYLIREFARNVQDVEAHDATGLRIGCRKTSKNVWRIDGDVTGGVTVRYRVYANELTVRTSHLDSSHAYVNGASIFMFARGMEGEVMHVRVAAPEGWRVATSLHETENGDFLAQDYDELVDCPLEIGEHRTIAWLQEGIPHRYAIWGSGEVDEKRLVADTRRIIEVCSKMFGGLPYERYLFILHIVPEGRGGLEHSSSTSLQVARSAIADPGYESLLALVAHEFFHVWLGRRIRPEPLGPYDYSAENYTRQLWVVEGFTTYYTDLLLVRAGLMTRDRYLKRIGDSIARYQAQPGRRHQSLENSSFDAWIKFYRPDAHTPNSQISYYHKGSLVALALDLEIRRAWKGKRSLDDVMRLLWDRYGSKDRGIPEEGAGEIREVIGEVLGGPVDDLFDAYVTGLDEIDFDGHLEAVGLALAEGDAGAGGSGGAGGVPVTRIVPPGAHELRLGVRLKEERERVRVTHVLEDSPAYTAGVNAGDELVAISGRRATIAAVGAAILEEEIGAPVELVLMRRDRLVTVQVRLTEVAARRARIVPLEEAGDEAQDAAAGWLEEV